MMTLDEMELTVCEKLSELVAIEDTNPIPKTIESAILNPNRKVAVWKAELYKNWRQINWSTEGLQVCHEASLVMDLPLKIERVFRGWLVTIWLGQTDERKVMVENKDLLAAWLEALCRVWFPERFN